MPDVLFIQGAGRGAYDEDARLVESLRNALGAACRIRYPRMPAEHEPTWPAWRAQIEASLAALEDDVVLVGHSLGASLLLKHLAETTHHPPVAAAFIIAAPWWGADDWDWDEVRLPDDAASRLARVPHLYLYHARDDEIVPFHHLALYAAALPNAVVRELEGDHQLHNDLTPVARDIRAILPACE